MKNHDGGVARSGTLSVASAAEDKLTPQQERPRNQAGDKKGRRAQAFISQCLKAAAPAAPMTQQDKMKKRDASAKSLKGDDRKTFMSNCLEAKRKM